jgi:hypothetical protein
MTIGNNGYELIPVGQALRSLPRRGEDTAPYRDRPLRL